MSKGPKPPKISGSPLTENESSIDQLSEEKFRGVDQSDSAPLGNELRKMVGRNIREARRGAGLTQTSVAEQINSAATYVGNIERGDANITLGMLARLATVIGVAPKTLLDDPALGPRAPESFGPLISALQASIRSQRAMFDGMEAVLKAMLEGTQKSAQSASAGSADQPS